MTTPLHWCLGMYGSASTWAFDVVRRLAAALNPDRLVVSYFASDQSSEPATAGATLVVKSHAGADADDLARRAAAIVITIRDPRDAVASLMAHAGAGFDLALEITEATALLCARFAADKRAILLKFEDRFYDDPATLDRLAASFRRALTEPDKVRIFAETRREAIEALIANLETSPTVAHHIDAVTGLRDMYDETTLWHKHHAGRKGEIGRWRRELSAPQAAAIERRLGSWMREFGYQPAPAYTLTIGRYDISL